MTSTADFTGTRTLDIAPEAIVEGSMFADRYAIEGRIGAGAQSIVYSALDMLAAPPRRVALKIARSATTNLAKEAELLTRIHDGGDVAGVVRLLEPLIHEFANRPYIVLGFIDGPTLRNANLPIGEVCRLGAQISQALAAIHKANIVFADVKPDNIVLREGTQAVLVDFGAAQRMDEAHSPNLLTPAYAAPEQHAGQTPAPASDVYSLALVLGELAAGRIPKKLSKILELAKAKDPKERPSAEEFAQWLVAVDVSKSGIPFRRHWWALAVAIATAAALFTFAFKENGERTRPAAVAERKATLVRVSHPGKVQYLASGETDLYWSDGDGGSVFRAAIPNGPPERMTQIDGQAHQLAVSKQTVFIRSPGKIWAFASGKLTTFAEFSGRGGIVADEKTVAWTNEDTGDVVLANIRNDAPFRVIASGQARPYSITMDATHVYWANEENGTIARVLRHGGPVELFVRGQLWPTSLLLDETHVYWLDRNAGALFRVAKDGSEPQMVARTSYDSRSITLGGTHVYWTSTEDGRVMRVPKIGGLSESVALGQPRPFSIAKRDEQLYFANYGQEGGVMRLDLP